jgi:hypothetical protein
MHVTGWWLIARACVLPMARFPRAGGIETTCPAASCHDSSEWHHDVRQTVQEAGSIGHRAVCNVTGHHHLQGTALVLQLISCNAGRSLEGGLK